MKTGKKTTGLNLAKSTHKKEPEKAIKVAFYKSNDKELGDKHRDMDKLFNIPKNSGIMPAFWSDIFPFNIHTLFMKARE